MRLLLVDGRGEVEDGALAQVVDRDAEHLGEADITATQMGKRRRGVSGQSTCRVFEAEADVLVDVVWMSRSVSCVDDSRCLSSSRLCGNVECVGVWGRDAGCLPVDESSAGPEAGDGEGRGRLAEEQAVGLRCQEAHRVLDRTSKEGGVREVVVSASSGEGGRRLVCVCVEKEMIWRGLGSLSCLVGRGL